MANTLAFAYSAVADKLGFDPKNEAAAIAKYLEPDSTFRAQTESWIEDLYKTVAAEFEGEPSVISNSNFIRDAELKSFIAKQKQTLLEQIQERYDRELKPNWVVTVSWTYLVDDNFAGATLKETKLVRADSSGESAEKACNACGLYDDPAKGWYEVDPQLPQKLTGPPEVVAVPFDEWVRANTVLA